MIQLRRWSQNWPLRSRLVIWVAVSFVAFTVVHSPYLVSQKNPYLGRIVREIEFRGLNNYRRQELIYKLSSGVSRELKPLEISRDIKQLYLTNYFSNIRVLGEILPENGVRLIYEFTENPLVAEVNYVGFERVSLAELQGDVETKEEKPLIEKVARADVIRLRKGMQDNGFPFANVWYEIEPYVDKKKAEPNQVAVYFFADSGDTIEVGKVNLLGIRNVRVDKVREILSMKEATAIEESFFSEESFLEDQEKLVFYMKSQGFLDAELDSRATGYEVRYRNPDRPADGRIINVTYAIQEFKRFFFAGYSVDFDLDYINRENNPPEHLALGNEPQPLFTGQQILNSLEYFDTDVGEVFNEITYLNDRSSIQNLYGNQGYVYVQARPEIVDFRLNEATLRRYRRCLRRNASAGNRICNRTAKRLPLDALSTLLKKNPNWKNRNFRHIAFTIQENFLAYVENIVIRGNDKTAENVIRREILIKEGQLFNSALVNESRRRLINTRYFKEVNLELRPASGSNSMTIIFDVEEQSTGMISLGAGLGTLSGFSVFAQLEENNLFGSGQRINGRIEYGPLRNSLSLNWTDPWYSERCAIISGGYWRKKMEAIDSASSLRELEFLLADLENEEEKLAQGARQIFQEARDLARRQNPSQVEFLDAIKSKLRRLFAKLLVREEKCFRNIPKPWSLNIGFSISNLIITVQPFSVSFVPGSLQASYHFQRYSFSVGTSHAISAFWSHYHYYIPSFQSISNVSALAGDEVFLRERLGLQFTSTVRNGVVFSNIDNVANPTSGVRTIFELDVTGGIFGGSDHFNRYTISNRFYFWWFDYYTKKNRNRKLRNYRVVQEFSFRTIFTFQTGPAYGMQDATINPFLEIDQRLYVGGTGSKEVGRLRGFDQTDLNSQPVEWANGADHLIEFGTEIRFPIDPSIAWFILFLDAVSLYDNLDAYTGASRVLLNNYQQGSVDSSQISNGASFTDSLQWNDPRRAILTTSNIALDRFLYTWGFGVRLQIPIFPLRIYFAQKLYYANGGLRHIDRPGSYDIVIGLGDVEF